MEKSVALFYCKNISKIFEKVCKNLLTNAKRCVIIGHTRKGKERKEVIKRWQESQEVGKYMDLEDTDKDKVSFRPLYGILARTAI